MNICNLSFESGYPDCMPRCHGYEHFVHISNAFWCSFSITFKVRSMGSFCGPWAHYGWLHTPLRTVCINTNSQIAQAPPNDHVLEHQMIIPPSTLTSHTHFPYTLPIVTSHTHFPYSLPTLTSPTHFSYSLYDRFCWKRIGKVTKNNSEVLVTVSTPFSYSLLMLTSIPQSSKINRVDLFLCFNLPQLRLIVIWSSIDRINLTESVRNVYIEENSSGLWA